MPILTRRMLMGATALVLLGLCALLGLSSVAQNAPSLGRKERDASSSREMANTSNKGTDCYETAVTDMLKAKGHCESTYTSCIFVCASQSSGAARTICVFECEQRTANCSALAEEEMEKSWYACNGKDTDDEKDTHGGGNKSAPVPAQLSKYDSRGGGGEMLMGSDAHPNPYCIGNQEDKMLNPDKNGEGAQRSLARRACGKRPCECAHRPLDGCAAAPHRASSQATFAIARSSSRSAAPTSSWALSTAVRRCETRSACRRAAHTLCAQRPPDLGLSASCCCAVSAWPAARVACCYCYRQCNLKHTEHIGCESELPCEN